MAFGLKSEVVLLPYVGNLCWLHVVSSQIPSLLVVFLALSFSFCPIPSSQWLSLRVCVLTWDHDLHGTVLVCIKALAFIICTIVQSSPVGLRAAL